MIDFVITWVDMDDPQWKSDFARYSGRIDNSKNETSEARFRDQGLLKYWFRGVELFAPWVDKIHFVTCGQKSVWLNTGHPKLRLVNHADYIPAQFLPCYNSNLIEIYMHQIPDLAEQFVYFNDDCFVIDAIGEERFFDEGRPNDIAAFRINTGLSQWARMLKNNVRLINQNFDKAEVFEEFGEKWFDDVYGSRGRLTKLLRGGHKFHTLVTPHNAQPYLKSTFEAVWGHCGEELTAMSTHRFRNEKDLTLELFRTWQMCSGNFNPSNPYLTTKMFPLAIRSVRAIEAIRTQLYRLVCINDNVHIRHYEQTMQSIDSAFASILPEKSKFEI